MTETTDAATTPQEKESSEAKFKRLAEARIPKTLKAIKLIGNLGNYSHTPAQTSRIMQYLRDAVDSVEYALGKEKSKASEPAFSLDEDEG